MSFREELSGEIRDLSQVLETLKSSIGKDIDGLKNEIHQINLELPRKINLVNEAVEIHSDEVN